jgi:plastocyanin
VTAVGTTLGGHVRARKLVVGGLVAMSLLGLSGCGGGDDDERLTADVTVEDEDLLAFEPKELEINLNEETTYTFLNDDDLLHNITIPAIFVNNVQNPVDVDLPSGQRVSVKIPAVAQAPRDGFFLFYCKFHQTQGMTGRIKISS